MIDTVTEIREGYAYRRLRAGFQTCGINDGDTAPYRPARTSQHDWTKIEWYTDAENMGLTILANRRKTGSVKRLFKIRTSWPLPKPTTTKKPRKLAKVPQPIIPPLARDLPPFRRLPMLHSRIASDKDRKCLGFWMARGCVAQVEATIWAYESERWKRCGRSGKVWVHGQGDYCDMHMSTRARERTGGAT